MKKIASALLSGITGIGIGNIIALIFSALYGHYLIGTPSFMAQFDNDLTAALIANGIYAVIGIVCFIASTFYDRMPLRPASAAHFATIYLTVGAAGLYLRWFNGIVAFLSFTVTFLLAYVIIWLIIYWSTKQEIAAINRSLKK